MYANTTMKTALLDLMILCTGERDLNHGSLVAEATKLPTMPKARTFIHQNRVRYIKYIFVILLFLYLTLDCKTGWKIWWKHKNWLSTSWRERERTKRQVRTRSRYGSSKSQQVVHGDLVIIHGCRFLSYYPHTKTIQVSQNRHNQ